MPGPIAVIVAMEAELRHFFAQVPVVKESHHGVWHDRWVEIGGQPVVVVRSGMGMAVAAAATERVIDAHSPTAVLNYGCAGAHHREIMPGDIVIGEHYVNHSRVQILPTGEERYVGFLYEVSGEPFEAADIAADPHLLAVTKSAAESYEPEPWPRDLFWPEAVPYRPPKIHSGTVVSSDIWTQSHDRLDLLHGRHSSVCEDMEAASVAQICALHGVPFVSIKDISNSEYHRASDIAAFADFPTAEVGRRAAGLAVRTIEELARDANR
ncbi:MAG: adenosylhomocysteine nucleosidase [Thermomicrobiales bacterium]|nr:adenosylhomocysteine nucleosidase [Thermomicrobiales bacterium]